jgi:acyl-coenzyme A thioesterase PaaI-like protein
MTSSFDRATAVSAVSLDVSPGLFHGEIEDGWDINGNANGGYLLALAANAMRAAAGRVDPITITAHFLAPGRPSAVTIATDIVKSGRQLATLNGSMRDAASGRELMRIIASFGDIAAMSGGYAHTVGAPPDLPPYQDCVPRTPEGAGTGVMVSLMNHLRVGIRPEDAGFRTGPTGRPSVEGWFEFADDRPIDTLALLLVVDAFPPPVFNIDIPPGWVPTVELTAHIRAVPAPGPVRCRFHTEFVQNGFLQEDGEVWDSTGTLVAQSRQLAMVPRT